MPYGLRFILARTVVAAIAHTHADQDAPPTSEVKPIKCSNLVKFFSKLVLCGWLMKTQYK